MKVIFTIGLPASGKSTWSIEETLKVGVERVSKDEMRKRSASNLDQRVMMKVKKLSKTTDVVIVDACNFQKHIDEIKLILEGQDVVFEEKVFDVDPMECIKRNIGRKDAVPPVVIWSFYSRYKKEGKLK